MHEAMLRKLKDHKKRVMIRRWEMRQIEHAKGTWYRLRRALAMTAAVYAIDDQQADALEHAGYASLPVGDELAPPKRLFQLTEQALDPALTRRPLRVKLDASLLGERNLVLVPWKSTP
jgi:hypothetical protein